MTSTITSTRGMGKLFIWTLCILLALDLPCFSDAARNKNRSRKGNRQSKRQENSEPVDCPDLNKKFLRLKYETMGRGMNASREPGLVMLPAPARPVPNGITFMPPTAAPRHAGVGTCPYTPVTNFDPTRWPRIIMEATCECDHCYLGQRVRGSNSDSCPTTVNSDLPEGYCRSIMRQIAVLRRAGCEGDFARYNQDVVTVSVGCECVIDTRPTTLE